MLERQPLRNLQKKKQLVAYRHKGFWQCMDTLREKILLEKLLKKKGAMDKLKKFYKNKIVLVTEHLD